MKQLILAVTLTLSANILLAQGNGTCTEHPLFNTLANHQLKECNTKEFEKLSITQTDKAKGSTTFDKSGEYIKVAYSFTGAFENRPSATQIYQNYVNAITKAGGQVLQNAASLYGKLKKGTDTWWIKVYADGSSWYWVESVKEGGMRQDIVVTADEIKSNLNNDGKISLYGIYFDNDKATIKEESAPTLTEMAKFLTVNTGTSVFIVGHTDNTGDYAHNVALSKERAAAVVNELVTKYKVNKAQLVAEGVGPLSPVAGNATVDGKAKNRRVEMVKKN